MSRGTKQDIWNGVAKKHLERDPTQCITVTVTLYYTVSSAVPTPNDIKAAISDLDQFYKESDNSRLLSRVVSLPLPIDSSYPLPYPSNHHLLKCPAGHDLYMNHFNLVCDSCHFSIRWR